MSQKSKIKNQKSQRGFTLLESMVAIAIFTVGISTAMAVISTSLAVGTRTRDKIIASYLAQEGIEAVRSIRDNNWVGGNDWLSGVTTCTAQGCAQTNGCIMWNGSAVDFTCSGGAYLTFNAASVPPAYMLTSSATKFLRRISVSVEDVDPTSLEPNKIQIASAVDCGLNCSVSLSEYLYNWK